MVHDLSQDVATAANNRAAPRQAVAGLMPPQLAEAMIREVWPTIRTISAGVAGLSAKLMQSVFLAPLGWMLNILLFGRKFAPFLCQRYTLTNRRLMIQPRLEARSDARGRPQGHRRCSLDRRQLRCLLSLRRSARDVRRQGSVEAGRRAGAGIVSTGHRQRRQGMGRSRASSKGRSCPPAHHRLIAARPSRPPGRRVARPSSPPGSDQTGALVPVEIPATRTGRCVDEASRSSVRRLHRGERRRGGLAVAAASQSGTRPGTHPTVGRPGSRRGIRARIGR